MKFGDHDVVIFDDDRVLSRQLNIFGWILSGFLVGVGARLCGGC